MQNRSVAITHNSVFALYSTVIKGSLKTIIVHKHIKFFLKLMFKDLFETFFFFKMKHNITT